MARPKFGDLIKGKGVYAGIYEVDGIKKEAYFEPDFLRDESGNQLLLNFYEARRELTRRNGCYYGSEAEVRIDIKSGRYKDGDLILPPREFLNGVKGFRERRDNHLVGLLKSGNGSVKKIRDTAEVALNTYNPAGNGSRFLSGTELDPSHDDYVYLVYLSGFDDWYLKSKHRSGVVPLRLFSPRP